MAKVKELSGSVFGDLRVLYRVGSNKDNRALWLCECSCKTLHKVPTKSLTSGNTTSCGCKQGQIPDLVGKVFSRLTVTKFLGIRKGAALWEVLCVCGTIREAVTGNLTSSRVKSCGCLAKEVWHLLGKQNVGSRNGQWKGGITDENNIIRGSEEYRSLRYKVFKRDFYKCCICSSTKKIQMHHVLNFSSHPELRLIETNNVTFCYHCHKEFHKRFTRKNNSYYQVIQFLLSKKQTTVLNSQST